MTNKNMSFNSFCFIYSQHAEARKTFFSKLKTEKEEKYIPQIWQCKKKTKLFLRNYRDKAKVNFKHSRNDEV